MQANPSASSTRKSATIYDIAKAAEVSHQSVSRYMRGLSMRPATTAKIEKALETLSYRPNLSARSLITGRSHRVGALAHEIDQVGPSLILQGATSAAREAGYLLDVVTLDMADESELSQALDLLTQHDLAGILAFASTDSTRSVFEQTDFGVPVVIAGETEALGGGTTPTDVSGISGLVAHLAELGHRSFLHIAGPKTHAAARNRRNAFEAAVAAHPSSTGQVVYGDWSARSGYQAISAFSLSAMPTAIVAANDQMALGAMHALAERQLSVPRDVSVTGIDDTAESAYFWPALTTIRLDFRAQGKAAFAALLERLDGTDSARASNAPQSTLVLRSSTAPPRV